MGDSWFWVRDSHTRVDPHQLLQSSQTMFWASQAVTDGTLALSLPSATAGVGALQDPALLALNAQIRGRRNELVALMVRFARDLERHGSWLSVAASIYASAESDAQMFAAACNEEATGCSANSLASAGSLFARLPSYAFSMIGSNSAKSSLAGLEAQQRIAALTGPPDGLGGALGISAIAGFAASAWTAVGSFLHRSKGGAFSGVAVERGDFSPEQTPRSASGLLHALDQVEDHKGTGEIKILRHEPSGQGRPSWTVLIPGTRSWLPGTTDTQDMLSNLQEVAGRTSDQQVAVLAAMDLAGIRPGDPVELVGHSQGGAVALSIASSEESSRFNFVSVLTAGAPSPGSPAISVPVLSLENTADIVPALDGKSAFSDGSATVIHFDARDLPKVGSGAHGTKTYAAAAEKLEQSNALPDLATFRAWDDHRTSALGLAGATTTGAVFLAKRTGVSNLSANAKSAGRGMTVSSERLEQTRLRPSQ